jgi:hypothetical protein
MRTLLRYIGRTGYPAISLYAVFLFHICSAQVQPRRYPRLDYLFVSFSKSVSYLNCSYWITKEKKFVRLVIAYPVYLLKTLYVGTGLQIRLLFVPF